MKGVSRRHFTSCSTRPPPTPKGNTSSRRRRCRRLDCRRTLAQVDKAELLARFATCRGNLRLLEPETRRGRLAHRTRRRLPRRLPPTQAGGSGFGDRRRRRRASALVARDVGGGSRPRGASVRSATTRRARLPAAESARVVDPQRRPAERGASDPGGGGLRGGARARAAGKTTMKAAVAALVALGQSVRAGRTPSAARDNVLLKRRDKHVGVAAHRAARQGRGPPPASALDDRRRPAAIGRPRRRPPPRPPAAASSPPRRALNDPLRPAAATSASSTRRGR